MKVTCTYAFFCIFIHVFKVCGILLKCFERKLRKGTSALPVISSPRFFLALPKHKTLNIRRMLSKKLLLCGLKAYNEQEQESTTPHRVTYNTNELLLDTHYDKQAIYLEVNTHTHTTKLHDLILQLLGRHKHRHLVLINNAPSFDQLHILPRELRTNLPKQYTVTTTPAHPRYVFIYKYQEPPLYLGVIRHTKIQSTTTTQTITRHENKIYIYFDPPIIIDRNNTLDTHTNITTPVACCGSQESPPRWEKLEYCTNYHEKRKKIYAPRALYIIRRKMMISLDPLPSTKPRLAYYQPEYTQYQTYAKQLLFHLNHQAKTIQKAWRRCISDPTYKVCQRRLTNEFTLESQALPRGAH